MPGVGVVKKCSTDADSPSILELAIVKIDSVGVQVSAQIYRLNSFPVGDNQTGIFYFISLWHRDKI